MDILKILNPLTECIDENRIYQNVSMKEHTSFKVGGEAKLLVLPKSIEEIIFAISVCKEHKVKYYVMGNGSNLIVRDEGYNGVIIKLCDCFNDITVQDDRIIAQSGALLSVVASKAYQNILTGLEFASGIPGTVGGAIVMNAGAYGGEMSQITEKVTALDKNGYIKDFFYDEIKFGYRHTIFHEEPFIILEICMKLEKGEQATIKQITKTLTEKRTTKQPLNYPSAGSIFKRPEGHYAGQLIEEAGLKGLAIGGARVSPLHAGFIINEGDATCEDILNLIVIIRSTVYEKFGVRLETEVKVLE